MESFETFLRGLLEWLRQSLDCLLQRFVGRRRISAEVNVRFFDRDIGRQALLVESRALRCEIANVGQQQTAAVRQFDELLTCGAADSA